MWRFKVESVDEPARGVRRLSGAATRKSRSSVGFYMTMAPWFIALSTEPNDEGRKLIAHFTRLLGEPTLRYRDCRGEYEDYTAEWSLIENQETIIQRILKHMALGFTPEELH